MVWGDGGAYATWFSGEPEMIQGINMLPITGGHFYLGDNPAYVTTNYNELVTNNGGPPTVWQDILWEFLALGNGDPALANFRADNAFTSEEGESKAHTFHWIRNLAALGTVDNTVTANHPLAKVFIKNGARTYVASNITNAAMTVTFSNGTTLAVPAGKTVDLRRLHLDRRQRHRRHQPAHDDDHHDNHDDPATAVHDSARGVRRPSGDRVERGERRLPGVERGRHAA